VAWVYILRCCDGTLYVGHTSDLAIRVARHNAGAASQYTACRRPVVLVFSEEHDTREAAVSREQQLKRWSATKKEALIRQDFESLHLLAKRRR
jgi:predicted GIY-YIG superfamily endonuclease